ncbi:hypothetical protein A33O_01717 [Nitratireductor aquibiodomus RA22]|uniref:Fumarylacetoacetate hydrolase n=1 Tax=Nitratireductor aquibiodomus RA22 TaxID=1189611 RepID=I5C7H3_9HYPH|nr:hypothetical protein A33O_01717 [Nitratireductor aquibiodomus RA22]
MVQAAGFPEEGVFVGRVWKPDVAGPALCVLRDGALIDITSPEAPTMRDLLEMDDPAGYARERAAGGERFGTLEAIAAERPANTTGSARTHLLAPNDLQAVKACGVTFARSMIERVIEERAAGDPSKAAAIRERCQAIIGDSLRDLKAGSEKAEAVKRALISEGVWSQYLEVGIGPDAEVFTKAQPMSSVGHGAEIGLHPVSNWNNPEPEIVLAVDSSCRVKGAALGNDVNLRDVEGRSALLLGKAKDNNASCAIGPFIRLFDDGYGMDDVRGAELDLLVTGEDGFVLEGKSSMAEISRDPLDLVAQTCGRHHQYPDGSCFSWARCLRRRRTVTCPVRDLRTGWAIR